MMVIKNQRDIIIYGAGWVGKIVYDYLRIIGIEVSAFAVTKLQNDEMIDQTRVLALDDALRKYPNAYIILAVLPDKQKEMQNTLESKSIADYFILPEILLYEMRRVLLKYHAVNWKYDIKESKGRLRIGYLYPGYFDTDYAERRLIINTITEADYILLPKVPGKIPYVDMDDNGVSDYKTFTEASYDTESVPEGIDLIHTFNMVCITNRPWIASFETTLPRVPITNDIEKAYYRQLADYIMKDNCKGILALCKTTYNIQCGVLRGNLPENIAEKIIKKTRVLHPPQEILISEDQFIKKHDRNQIQFIFVGHSFFIKGGREIINALINFEGKYDFQLTIISSLLTGDYFTHASDREKLRIQKIMGTKKWINYYSNLPNDKVLELCKQASVGLLPSFADTYGYAVLEMQASGCPVVTTNVRAFPEINDKECGWICSLPVNEYGMCDAKHLPELSIQLEGELVQCFSEIFQNPKCIKEKGRKALKKVKQLHDPKAYADVIRDLIY